MKDNIIAGTICVVAVIAFFFMITHYPAPPHRFRHLFHERSK